MTARTPVVDIFAGPGGLSEGFSAVLDGHGSPAFDVVLSIEMEPSAFETLKLRTFFRQFYDGAPAEYYQFLREEIDINTLYDAHPTEAASALRRCWRARLGPSGVPAREVQTRINEVVRRDEPWVLIGGPPCQAYSLAGRSRNHGNPNYSADSDERQRLYVEYLQILADHRPAVFILENVKGLLSATLANEQIFGRILADLSNPAAALDREGRETATGCRGGYRICSLTERQLFENGNLSGSVIKAEKYGVPQSRHRVILLGVRDDVSGVTPDILHQQSEIPMAKVIDRLPKLRSGLSRSDDSSSAWVDLLRSQAKSRWANAGAKKAGSEELSSLIRESLLAIKPLECGRGGEFVPGSVGSDYLADWYCDEKIGGVCNHSARGHMPKDLYRYMYAACYTLRNGKSPGLHQFPKDLQPNHASANTGLGEVCSFSDRFRVQVAGKPSTTIMSHISKDGHYYIHPDPAQCRSLTVREAARLQTFPDNYYFCGPRTAQYVQVGNAVPPLLAKQIGDTVHRLLQRTQEAE